MQGKNNKATDTYQPVTLEYTADINPMHSHAIMPLFYWCRRSHFDTIINLK